MKARLGINIDHVATLRQARGETYPSLPQAADLALRAGADQITIHLREDRRHIQDRDTKEILKITQNFQKPLNFEMGCAPDIIQHALELGPEWICLVPEKREEKTTEGGLDLLSSQQFERISQTIESLRKGLPQTKISLFLQADQAILNKAAELRPEAVEVHTGDYASSFLHQQNWEDDLQKFSQAKKTLDHYGIACHAGHGLTLSSLRPLAQSKLFEEYNIGHWVIAQSIFQGLKDVIEDLKKTLNT